MAASMGCWMVDWRGVPSVDWKVELMVVKMAARLAWKKVGL